MNEQPVARTSTAVIGEGFAFACWYRQSFLFFSTYKTDYFNRCALDDWGHGHR